MAIQYANLTYSYVVDNLVDLPAGVPPGQLAYVVNTAKAYYSTNGTWKEVGLGVTGGYQPYKYSYDNPPASPNANDDEFNTTSLNAAWTIDSSGTTNPATTGTINPLSSLTTPIVDAASIPGWIMFQSDNSSTGLIGIRKSITLDTNCTIFVKFCADNRTLSTTGEGSIGLWLKNSSDSNEGIYLEAYNTAGSGLRHRMNVENNGVFTAVSGNITTEASDLGNTYMVLWKSTNTYHAAYTVGGIGAVFCYLGSVAKTGTTTFDRVQLMCTTANETPSLIYGFDFIRYYPSITYALMN